MEYHPRQFTYALLGRDHKHVLSIHSADITIHRVEFFSEKFTYMYYGFVTQGAYTCKEIAMGNINLEWGNVINEISLHLKTALSDNYPVASDFALRLAALKKNKQAQKRFERTIEKFNPTTPV